MVSSSLIRPGKHNPDNKPFIVIVRTVVKEARIEDFLKIMEHDAVESRKEPGCHRFDVIQSQDEPHTYYFYELYENAAAFDYHKQQPYFDDWSKFLDDDGAETFEFHPGDGVFMT